MKHTTGRAWLGAITALGMAAGCSDGGSGSSPEGGSFVELTDEVDALAADSASLDFTEPSTLPTSGSATYDGVMIVNAEDEGVLTSLAGDLRMEVDFGAAADPISGAATGFVASNEDRWDGSLDISNSALSRDADVLTEFTYVADVGGTLTDPEATSYDVSGGLRGDFAGSDAAYVGGEVAGSACSEACVPFDGGFLAVD